MKFKFVPKKYLCYFSLDFGALCVGIFYSVIMTIVIFVSAVQVSKMSGSEVIKKNPWRHAFGCCYTALLYAAVLLIINVIFIYGVIKNNSTIVLSWVIINSQWLIHSTLTLFVLVPLYHDNTSPTSLYICLILGIIGVGFLLYCLLTVFGFWLQIKEKNNNNNIENE